MPCLSGFCIGFDGHRGVGARLFCSAAIVRRHYATILETKDGITVTISGFINRDRTRENGFSFQVCPHFRSGLYSDFVFQIIWCSVLFVYCCSYLSEQFVHCKEGKSNWMQVFR